MTDKKSLHRQKLKEYLQKLADQQRLYEQTFESIRGQFKKQSQQLIDDFFIKAKNKFSKCRKTLKQELTSLQYYEQNPQEKVNLYPLFTAVDQKLRYNVNLIEESQLKFVLPFPSKYDVEDDVLDKKNTILQNYIVQLLAVLKSQNIKKYCKKQSQAATQVTQTYQKLLENVKESLYCSQVKIKRVFQEGLSELTQFKHVQTLHLSLYCSSGILMPEHYHKIVTCLLANRAFLTTIHLKIMDMQFSQQKCDILRKRLSNQLKNLRQVSIHNYYKECKLGEFQDFNWHPYRKKVNITSGVW